MRVKKLVPNVKEARRWVEKGYVAEVGDNADQYTINFSDVGSEEQLKDYPNDRYADLVFVEEQVGSCCGLGAIGNLDNGIKGLTLQECLMVMEEAARRKERGAVMYTTIETDGYEALNEALANAPGWREIERFRNPNTSNIVIVWLKMLGRR